MSDDATGMLLHRIAQGERPAFRDLYDSCAPKLTGVLMRMLRDRTEVDDALQDIFVKIWQRAAQFDPERGTGMSWLVALTRNHALDRLRARPEARGLRQVGPAGEDDSDPLDRLVDPARGPEATLIAQGEARRVLDCFDTLEPDRAQALRGAYLDGLSYQALSERHAVPLNTMRTWLRRGLMRLKECLES